MDLKIVLTIFSFVTGSLALYASHTGDPHVDERVNRITRAEDVHGYDFAHLYTEDKDTPATKRDVIDQAEHPSQEQRSLELRLTSGESLRMSLRKRSVVSPDTIVVEVNGDADVQTRRLGKRDCYFSGPTEGTAGHASLAMCGGRLMGSVMTEKRHYEVHALPEGSTANRRSTDPLRVLVTWTDVDDSDQYKRYANDSADSYDDDDDSDDDSGEDGMEGLWDDEVEIPEAEQDEDDRRSVSSRSVADRKAVVEVINYLDHWYLQKVENNLGLTTTDELIDLQVMKWSGAQAILGDADRVTWDIKIKLFKIEIWRTDPSWYVTNPNNTIGGRLAKICQGTKDRTDADQVTLSTASTSDGGRIGLSYISTVCKPRWRCAAVITANLKHGTELHEFGHSLGLNHDGKMSCPSGTKGFMGGNNFFYRTDCYTSKFDNTFPYRGCLFTDKHNSSNTIYPLLPGQTIGVKDQCEARYGAGYEYLRIGDGDAMCKDFGCMNTDAGSVHHGTVQISKALDGTPCGTNKVCRGTICDQLSSAQISVDENEIQSLSINGGWGSFGALSGCSSNCGPAVRISRRPCNNPTPRYGTHCVGDEYKAELCSSQACSGESSNESDLVEQRADKICNHMKSNAATNDDYSGEGQVVGTAGVTEKCRVKCQKTSGKWGKTHYLLPDGTPCKGTDTTSSSNISWHCVKGRCMAFGCNGKTLGVGGGQENC